MLKEIPKSNKWKISNSTRPELTTKQEQIKELGFTNNQVSQFQKLADNKDIVEQHTPIFKFNLD